MRLKGLHILTLPTDDIFDQESFLEILAALLEMPPAMTQDIDTFLFGMEKLDQTLDALEGLPPGMVVGLQVDDADTFVRRYPDLWSNLLWLCTQVNANRLENGREPLFAVLPVGDPPQP